MLAELKLALRGERIQPAAPIPEHGLGFDQSIPTQIAQLTAY